ncbi:fibrous sheath CABYR-binding protein-like, partial [Chiloscyllium plagiosum]|uniref:fibrous sheath CABYR-binding protein-like n=1 Tax=Chiloscyllium plagiosum TaxID=36176 RepID=UPI001CB7E09F
MSSLQTEEFFDLIACSQSRRLNDQRADFEESPTVALSAPFPTGPVEYLAPLGSMVSQTQSAASPPAAPAEREETPAEGRESPAEAEEQPAEHEQFPVGRERLPTEGEEAPAERQEIPAEREEAPAERQEIPAEREEAPAEREEIPAEGEEAPVYKAMYQEQMSTGTKGPDDELYNIILTHQVQGATKTNSTE